MLEEVDRGEANDKKLNKTIGCVMFPWKDSKEKKRKYKKRMTKGLNRT